jgi:hypothetical protein
MYSKYFILILKNKKHGHIQKSDYECKKSEYQTHKVIYIYMYIKKERREIVMFSLIQFINVRCTLSSNAHSCFLH